MSIALVLGVDSNHSFQPSFFSRTDRGFPWGSDGFLKRFGSLERMETDVSPRDFLFF